MKQQRLAKWMILLGGMMTVLLQFAHAYAFNPVLDLEPETHIHQHVEGIEHDHQGEETIADDDLSLILIHSVLHTNLTYYLNTDLLLPVDCLPVYTRFAAADPRLRSRSDSPPVPPPLA
ncbi:MAG: hypothetical protein Tsb002_19190 [Wenzhouxiangellaceae bacterium]